MTCRRVPGQGNSKISVSTRVKTNKVSRMTFRGVRTVIEVCEGGSLNLWLKQEPADAEKGKFMANQRSLRINREA